MATKCKLHAFKTQVHSVGFQTCFVCLFLSLC